MTDEITEVTDASGSIETPGTPTAGSEQATRRRTLYWTIAAVVAVALIAGLAYATNREPGDSDSTKGSSAGETTQTAGMPGTVPTNPGSKPKPGQTAPMPTPAPGKTTTSTAPPMGGRPSEPVAEGSKLATVTQPPPSTLAMIDPSKLSADARYGITFSPYGFGPPRSGQRSLVINIRTATAQNDGAKELDLTGRNVLASVQASENQSPVTVGGTYTGVLTFRSEGGLLVPVISEVEPK